MTGQDIAGLAVPALIIGLWLFVNDYDVATVTAKPGISVRLVVCAALGTWDAVDLPFDILAHNWPLAIEHAVVAALCARVVWSWWRRRRQGKPSRVSGLVQDLGHKLGVVAVPVPVVADR